MTKRERRENAIAVILEENSEMLTLAHLNIYDATAVWSETNLDVTTIAGYLAARCFNPAAALQLDKANIWPIDAAIAVGHGAHVETIGYYVASGLMTTLQAKNFIFDYHYASAR